MTTPDDRAAKLAEIRATYTALTVPATVPLALVLFLLDTIDEMARENDLLAREADSRLDDYVRAVQDDARLGAVMRRQWPTIKRALITDAFYADEYGNDERTSINREVAFMLAPLVGEANRAALAPSALAPLVEQEGTAVKSRRIQVPTQFVCGPTTGCGKTMLSTDRVCPHCGTGNPSYSDGTLVLQWVPLVEQDGAK